jgi:diaminopimelate epimerase
MRVWERGSGETLAQGTGASAAGCFKPDRTHKKKGEGKLRRDLMIELNRTACV